MNAPLASIRGLTIPGILHNVSLDIHPGERLGVCLLYTSDAADE